MAQEKGRSQFGIPVRVDHQTVLRFTGTPAAMANPSELINVFRGGLLIVSGLTTETIQVKGRISGDGADVDSDPIQIQKTDGTIQAATTLGNGTYYFDVLFERLIITKSAASENASVTVYLRS